MTSVAEIIAALGRIAPFDKAAGWDPVGLQVGAHDAPVQRVAVCHEVTDAVVAAAGDTGVDLLVTYHPLLFRATRTFVAGSGAEGRAFALASRGIALAVVHTAYDVVAGGVADAMAEALGLDAVGGFAPLWGPETLKLVTFVPPDDADAVVSALAAAGAGTIGNYEACAFRADGFGTFRAGPGTNPHAGAAGADNREPEVRIEINVPAARRDAVAAALRRAHPYEEPAFDLYERSGDAGMVGRVGELATTVGALASTVAERLGGAVRFSGAGDTSVSRVAVLPGSGSDFIAAARAEGADVLVTGDVSHHRARTALDRGLAIIDPGHIPGERPGVARLYAAVSSVVSDAVDLTEFDPDPWRTP